MGDLVVVAHSLPQYSVRILQFLSASLIAGFCALPFAPTLAHAQISNSTTEAVASSAGLSSSSVLDIIGTLINVFLGLLGVVFLLLVLYGGFLWMTAGGDDKQVDKARKIIINATVGLVITLSAYAIALFVVNWISRGTGLGSGSNGSNGGVSVEQLSGSLGSGALRDHYPTRNQTDVARNTRIIVTFRDAMDIESFISGYNTNGTPTNTADDTVTTAILADNISIYKTADGIESALTDASVTFSSDLKTFVFNPSAYLGSSTETASYTVFLSSNILDANGDKVFTGSSSTGYEWSFETGTTVDTTAPEIVSVIPSAGGTYARNITVQMTFSEAVDPITASGTRTSSGGYDIIQTYGADEVPLEGTYALSNGYKTVTFTPTDACGTNSCGETMYCLPPSEGVTSNVVAATPGVNPPQIDVYPYDGIADISGNALDGNGDGTAGDDYTWSFHTTSATELDGAEITQITPDLSSRDGVPLDQTVMILFDDVMLLNTVSSDQIALTNTELSTNTSHEMWYRFDSTFLGADSAEIVGDQVPTQTLVRISHGTFLVSLEGKTYMYGVTVGDGVKNQYQNCFAPAVGPSDTGGQCTGPYCCNGIASSAACTLF